MSRKRTRDEHHNDELEDQSTRVQWRNWVTSFLLFATGRWDQTPTPPGNDVKRFRLDEESPSQSSPSPDDLAIDTRFYKYSISHTPDEGM
jgi:hypothetical protein